MFVNLNILSFGEQLCKSVFSFKKIIINSDNSLVHGIVNSAALSFSKILTWWSDILNTKKLFLSVNYILLSFNKHLN